MKITFLPKRIIYYVSVDVDGSGVSMKTQLLTGLTTAAAAVALIGASAPAQAFSFGTNGIQFDENTDIIFTFTETRGLYQSNLQIFEVDPETNAIIQSVATLFSETQRTDVGKDNLTDKYLGTFEGGTVANKTATFTFVAGKLYTLGVVNVKGNDENAAPTVYSSSILNASNKQQAVFGALGSSEELKVFDAGSYQSATFAALNTLHGSDISFEDILGGGDSDYNDFQLTAKVPEPFTLGGLALGASGLMAARRRRRATKSN